MPTFLDPIVLEDIDINDPLAKFYLIQLPNKEFKFCGTTQDLHSPAMNGDPETRINKYWPVGHKQLANANWAILFPNDKIRSAPFKTIEELNESFNFDPPFTLAKKAEEFGPIRSRPGQFPRLFNEIQIANTRSISSDMINYLRENSLTEDEYEALAELTLYSY